MDATPPPNDSFSAAVTPPSAPSAFCMRELPMKSMLRTTSVVTAPPAAPAVAVPVSYEARGSLQICVMK